ncbi:hypothetical protein AVEN_62737-1 [Araneus ventricosus]|uniref:Chloride channel CLIC-like protein 1 n=1 Tax=Araneus ventricosus TaxID=182803 RepID=A0A4Y2IM83_ARAVE|nr:hypothetical protein AVEN_62737-1 [Araneus ventricosus]
MYVSLNKFVGEWIDPYSLGIFDGNIEFEEELEDSYTVHSEEIMINKKETWKSPESFSGHRTLLKNKLKDGSGIDGIFVTESNTVFSLGRNLMTVSAILTFVVFILFLFFPKTLIFSFVLIVSMLWHWMKLYQEKIAEKQNLTENLRHPNECRRGDLHWYEAISLYLSSYASSPTDCKEYYKAQLVDPFWEVSLPVAMMNAFTSTSLTGRMVSASASEPVDREFYPGLCSYSVFAIVCNASLRQIRPMVTSKLELTCCKLADLQCKFAAN